MYKVYGGWLTTVYFQRCSDDLKETVTVIDTSEILSLSQNGFI